MSSPPVVPDQPAKARYATPSVPAAMEAGGPTNAARYTGGTSIWTLGPPYGGGGAAPGGGAKKTSQERGGGGGPRSIRNHRQNRGPRSSKTRGPWWGAPGRP